MADAPKVLQAEQIDGGVLISFDDGRTALYSAAMLYAHIAQADEIYESEEEEE